MIILPMVAIIFSPTVDQKIENNNNHKF
jgi:hypothetical protein